MLVNPPTAQDVVQDCVTDRGCSSTPDARDLISLTVAVTDKDGKTPLPYLSYMSVVLQRWHLYGKYAQLTEFVEEVKVKQFIIEHMF